VRKLPTPPPGSEHWQNGWEIGYEQALVDVERADLTALRDELDQQRARAEAAEAELEAYRRAEQNAMFGTTCIDCGDEITNAPTVATVEGDLLHVGCGDPDEVTP
jgi:hypothetical protein